MTLFGVSACDVKYPPSPSLRGTLLPPCRMQKWWWRMDWPACGRGLRPRALRAPSPLRSIEPSRWFSSITCCGRQESATVRSEWVLPRVMSSFAKPTEDTFASVPDAKVVVEDGFEPSKVGDRLIYSQMRLATSLLHRTKKKRFSSRLTPQSARTFCGATSRRARIIHSEARKPGRGIRALPFLASWLRN